MTEKTGDMFEDELDSIRLRIYNRIKDMTPEEEEAYFVARTEPVFKRFNIKVSPLRPVKPGKREYVAD